MSEDELRDLTAGERRAGEIERIGSGLAGMMRQSNRPAAASLAEDLAIEVASVRRDLGRLAKHVLEEPTGQPGDTSHRRPKAKPVTQTGQSPPSLTAGSRSGS